MVANTGTYLDSPFHRFEHGKDVSALSLSRLASLQALVVRVEDTADRAIDREVFLPFDLRGKAVLVHTGWAGTGQLTGTSRGIPFSPVPRPDTSETKARCWSESTH